MRKIILFIGFLVFVSNPTLAQQSQGGGEGFGGGDWQFSLGVHQAQSKVQNVKGTQDNIPLSYGVSVGYDLGYYWGQLFSPQLGYIRNTDNSDDNYSSYKMETIYVLYDFVHRPQWTSSQFSFRYGLGNFIKKIDGGGGTVTVPNGGGSITAHKASTATSFTGSMNLGMQWDFGEVGNIWGLRFNVFAFEVLEPKKMQLTYNLNATWYL